MRPAARLCALLLAFTAPLAPVAAHSAETALKPFTARYGITFHGMSAGNSNLELKQLPDGRWSYSTKSAAKGLFRIAMPADLSSQSLFRVEAGGIVPEAFIAEDGASSTEKDQNVTFDWARGRITGVAERKQVDLPIQPGTLDSLSVQVALMHELLSGRQPSKLLVFDTDQVKDYLYTREGAEKIRTAVGEHDTVVFSSRRPGSKKATYFWCAPALGYVPLKVERRDGKDVEWYMTLKTVAIAP